jgi:hypothetical protein
MRNFHGIIGYTSNCGRRTWAKRSVVLATLGYLLVAVPAATAQTSTASGFGSSTITNVTHFQKDNVGQGTVNCYGASTVLSRANVETAYLYYLSDGTRWLAINYATPSSKRADWVLLAPDTNCTLKGMMTGPY